MTTRPPASITKVGASEPFELQVARGQIPWHSQVNIFGYQAAVTTAGPYPVWEVVGAYTYPASASTMLLYSSSASDTNCAVLISGLDSNYNQISETLVLTNGTTGVTTVNSYLRINGMVALDASYTLPVGNIILGNAGKTVIYAQMNAGIYKSQMAIYTVPAGYTFYLVRVDAYANEAGSGNNYAIYRVYQKNNVSGQTFYVLQSPFIGRYEARRVIPFPYTEKSDLQWQVATGTSTSPVGVIIEGILIKNNAGTP